MSYSYYLSMAADEAPSKILAAISEIVGVAPRDETVGASGMLIGVVRADEYDADAMESVYRFRPRVRVTFRHSSVDVRREPERTMLTIVARLLERIPGNAALESEDPQTLLVRTNDALTVNQAWSGIALLRQLFPGSVAAVFSEL